MCSTSLPSSRERALLAKAVADAGGRFTPTLSRSVTHLIVGEAAAIEPSPQQLSAKLQSIRDHPDLWRGTQVARAGWVAECQRQGRLVPISSAWQWLPAPAAAAPPPQADKPAVPAGAVRQAGGPPQRDDDEVASLGCWCPSSAPRRHQEATSSLPAAAGGPARPWQLHESDAVQAQAPPSAPRLQAQWRLAAASQSSAAVGAGDVRAAAEQRAGDSPPPSDLAVARHPLQRPRDLPVVQQGGTSAWEEPLPPTTTTTTTAAVAADLSAPPFPVGHVAEAPAPTPKAAAPKGDGGSSTPPRPSVLRDRTNDAPAPASPRHATTLPSPQVQPSSAQQQATAPPPRDARPPSDHHPAAACTAAAAPAPAVEGQQPCAPGAALLGHRVLLDVSCSAAEREALAAHLARVGAAVVAEHADATTVVCGAAQAGRWLGRGGVHVLSLECVHQLAGAAADLGGTGGDPRALLPGRQDAPAGVPASSGGAGRGRLPLNDAPAAGGALASVKGRQQLLLGVKQSEQRRRGPPGAGGERPACVRSAPTELLVRLEWSVVEPPPSSSTGGAQCADSEEEHEEEEEGDGLGGEAWSPAPGRHFDGLSDVVWPQVRNPGKRGARCGVRDARHVEAGDDAVGAPHLLPNAGPAGHGPAAAP